MNQWAAVVALLVFSVGSVRGAVSAECRETIITVDHAAGKVSYSLCLGSSTEVGELEAGGRLRVPIAPPIRVRVEQTNTALYSYGLKATAFEVEEIADLKAFLKQLGPYLLDIPVMAREAKRGISEERHDAIDVALGAVKKALDRVSKATLDIHEAHIATLDALESMRAPNASPPSIASTLRASLSEKKKLNVPKPTQRDDCGYDVWVPELLAVDGLLDAFRDLAAALGALREAVGPRSAEETAGIEAEATKVLDSAEAHMAAVYATEALVARAINAQATWCSQPFRVSASKGRDLEVKVARRAEAPLKRLGALTDIDFAAKVLPDWRLRPVLGLSLIAALDARYPVYDAVSLPGDEGQFEIQQTSEVDKRLFYGLSLGAAWRFGNRQKDDRVSLLLPEISLNPSSDDRAIGLGGAVIFARVLKVGVGFVWQRHEILDGQEPGMTVGEGGVKTRSSYGDPKFYVSVSIVGWPPFVSE